MAELDFSTLRQAAGYTIKELAEILEISVSTAYRYQSGESKPRAAEIQAIKGLTLAKHKGRSLRTKKDGWFTFVDLFAGIGGLRRGFDAIGGKCVFTSE